MNHPISFQILCGSTDPYSLSYLALNRIACADSLLETFTATISAKPTSKLPFLKLDIPVYADPLLTLSRIIILVIQRENSRTEFMQIRDEVLGIVDDRYIEKVSPFFF